MPTTSASTTKRGNRVGRFILPMGVLIAHVAFAQSPNKGVPDHGPSYKGRQAANFVLRDLTGTKVALRDFAGKPVVVNFWATWCPPCLEEMPWFEELSKKYAGTGLTFIGINVESEGGDVPQNKIVTTVRRLGVTYPILLSDGSLAKHYGSVPSLPETFYINKRGVIVEDVWSHTDRSSIENYIRAMIR